MHKYIALSITTYMLYKLHICYDITNIYVGFYAYMQYNLHIYAVVNYVYVLKTTYMVCVYVVKTTYMPLYHLHQLEQES